MRAYAAPGTQALRGWQRRALVRYLAAPAISSRSRRPAQDHLRAADRRRAARRRHRRRGHRGRADRAPQEPVGAGGRPASASRSTRVPQRRPALVRRTSTAWSSPTRRSASHPARHRARTENRRTLVILDEIHHAGDARLGRRRPRGVRAADPAADADRHAVPHRRQPDPVRQLRARRRRPAALPGRPRLRLRRRARRRRRPAGDLPGLLGRGALAQQRGRGAGRAARRADDRRADGAGVAHRARPGRRLDASGARGPPTRGSSKRAAGMPDAGGLSSPPTRQTPARTPS